MSFSLCALDYFANEPLGELARTIAVTGSDAVCVRLSMFVHALSGQLN
jgi:hypothetical protein